MTLRQAVLDQLHRVGRTSPGQVVRNRRESNLIINTIFRSLAGRYPSAEERSALVRRSLEGASFEELVLQVAGTEAAVDRLTERIRPALQARLHWDFERTAPDPIRFSDRVVFLHIMKTGGISLTHICSTYPASEGRSWGGLYIDDLFLQPRAVIARLRFISGHIPYQALEVIPGPFKTATVLRDPIARTISHFSELRQSEPLYADLTLDAFVNNEGISAGGNYQARQLAHRIDLDGAWSTYDPYEQLQTLGGAPTELPLGSLFDTIPFSSSDDVLLETAAHNLETIDFVGITEDMSTVAAPIADLFGGTFTGMPRLHVSPSFDHRQLTDPIRKKLEERTAVDRELYDQACRRVELQKKLDSESPPDEGQAS